MNERDGRAAAAGPGGLVDHPVTVRLDRLERLRAVGDPVADVVQALALRREVLGDGRVGAGRGQQLHVGVGDLQQRLFDPVALDDLTVLDFAAERLAVVVDRGVEVVDGDRDMVDLGQQHVHASSGSRTGGTT